MAGSQDYVNAGDDFRPSAAAWNRFLDTSKGRQRDRTIFRHTPIEWSASGLAPFIVTQLNGAALVSIYRETVLSFNANPSYPDFDAQPWDDPSANLLVSGIDASENIQISSRCMTGALFTGQVFMCDVASKTAVGGDGTRYRGVVSSVGSGVATVTLTYLGNVCIVLAGAAVDQTVDVIATNDTGSTLTVGQKVIVDLMNHLGTKTSRWRISEYEC